MDYLFDNIVKRSDSSNTSYSSRYRRLSRITDDEDNYYIESPDNIVFPESNEDIYHVVQAGEENRLDLISYMYYGNSLLYWAIAIASGIDDPLVVPAGMVLRIPSKQSLYGYKGVLS